MRYRRARPSCAMPAGRQIATITPRLSLTLVSAELARNTPMGALGLRLTRTPAPRSTTARVAPAITSSTSHHTRLHSVTGPKLRASLAATHPRSLAVSPPARPARGLTHLEFHAHTGCGQHPDQRINAEELDLPSHEIAHSRLRHPKQSRGIRLPEPISSDDITNRFHELGAKPQMRLRLIDFLLGVAGTGLSSHVTREQRVGEKKLYKQQYDQ